MTRLDDQAGTGTARAGAENILPDRRGVFEYQPWKADQINGAEAVALVAALRHEINGQQEPVWLQTFADAPDEAYAVEKKTAQSGKPYTVRRWRLTDVPKSGGKVGKVQGVAEQGRAVSLAELAETPYRLANMARVGVFFAVNVLAPHAPRRRAEHVARVAAVFLDLDGAPLPASFPLEPTATVESSSGRHHVYWAVDGVPLEEFTTIQKTLAALYGADPAVSDLPRVMRLPGYYHGKKAPGELVRLTSCAPENQYTHADLLEAWPELVEALAAAAAEQVAHQQDAEQRRAAADELRQQLSSGTAGTRAEVLHKYGQIALLGCCADLLAAPVGQRDVVLNAVSYRAGRVVGAGVLEEAEALAELRDVARRIGLEEGEISNNLNPQRDTSGIAKGKLNPIEADKIGQFVGVKKGQHSAALKVAREKVEKAPAERGAGRYTMPTLPRGTDEGTDEANALVLAANGAADRLRYRFGDGWYVYDERRGVWVEDDAKLTLSRRVVGPILRTVIGNHAAELLKRNARDEEIEPVLAWRKSVGNNWALNNALAAAAGMDEFVTEADAWNARADLLNCQNGTLELTSGTLRPHSPADLLTWQAGAAFDPAARHEYVDQLTDLLRRDGRHDFLQRLTGSTLYGEAPNEVAVILEGEGGTGKGTLVSAVTAMLGDYATTVDVGLLLANAHGESATGPKPELMKLQGKRLAIAGEPPKGARFNAGRVKGMTGNDPITARQMNSKIMVTFKPVFKLWIHTNYPINTAHDDTGMQRRLRVVPFNAKPEQPYAAFKSTLENDPSARAALLNWAYEGFRLWHAQGFDLGMSAEIEAATGAYWKDQNPYERFAAERLTFGPDFTMSSARLKSLFEDWAEENGAKMGRGVKMAELYTFIQKPEYGAESGRTREGRFWYGVAELVTEVTPVTAQPLVGRTPPLRVAPTRGQGVTGVTGVTGDDVSPVAGWEGDEL